MGITTLIKVVLPMVVIGVVLLVIIDLLTGWGGDEGEEDDPPLPPRPDSPNSSPPTGTSPDKPEKDVYITEDNNAIGELLEQYREEDAEEEAIPAYESMYERMRA